MPTQYLNPQTLIFLVVCAIAILAVVTSPLWMRVGVSLVKGLSAQMKEAGEAVDREFRTKFEMYAVFSLSLSSDNVGTDESISQMR